MKFSHPKRYDIHLANLDPTLGSEIKKTRPVVIVSDDFMKKCLETVVTCPLTTKIHGKWQSRVQIMCKYKPSEIAIDQIRTISKLRLIKRIDSLNSNDAKQLRITITEMYGENS